MKINFDWIDFLARATRNEVTEEQWKDAEAKSGSWVTCGCGNRCDTLPRRDSVGAPVDEELYSLGLQFPRAIRDRAVERAKEILFNIEKRASQLLCEQAERGGK